MTILVTGGNGWVPCHVARRFARRGERVVSYDLMPPDALLEEFLGDEAERVIFEQGDVTDEARLREVAERHRVTSIVHAAAITPRIDRERREPRRIIEVNLDGTINALEVARALPGFGRFIQISSCAVWGEVPGAAELDEDSPANATSLYGVTKLAGERTALRYHELFGLDVVAVRPGNVYGPMERPTPGYGGATELREMLRLHSAGEPVRVASLSGASRDWTFVEEIAEGIERLWAVAAPRHRLYSLTGGRLHTVGEVLAQFSQHLPGFRFEVVAADDANFVVSGAPPGPVPTNARLRADIGWAPAPTLDEGMRHYAAWIERHGPQ